VYTTFLALGECEYASSCPIAKAGAHQSGRNTYGHSMIIGPWSNILCEYEQGSGMIVADIDLDELKK